MVAGEEIKGGDAESLPSKTDKLNRSETLRL